MRTTRLPHQEKAFQAYKDLNNIAIFWTMGRGKTKLAIDIANYKFKIKEITRVVLIAPNTVHTQWVQEELPKHSEYLCDAFVYHTNNTKKFIKALDSFIMEHPIGKNVLPVWLALHIDALNTARVDDLLRRYVHKGKTLWIIDEASRIKNPRAKRTIKATTLHRLYGGPSIILTGTALAKRPADVWAMCEFMDHSLLNQTYTSFEQQYSVLIRNTYEVNTKNGIGKKQVELEGIISEPQWNRVLNSVNYLIDSGHSEAYSINYTANKYRLKPYDVQFIYNTKEYTPFRFINELKQRLSSFASFIEAKDDIQLPEKIYRTVSFELEPEKVKLLQELRKYAVTVYEESVMTLTNKAALHTKALQICGGTFAPIDANEEPKPIKCANRKLNYIIEYLDEIGELQFIIFAVFTAEIEMLYDSLKDILPCAKLYGATSQSDRDNIVADFKAGKLQCIICNPSVAGYGLNLQNASLQIWYSRSYTNEDRIQAEGRSHRFGIVESPVYIDLVYKCKFEEKVLDSNRMGTSMNSYFNCTSISDLLSL